MGQTHTACPAYIGEESMELRWVIISFEVWNRISFFNQFMYKKLIIMVWKNSFKHFDGVALQAKVIYMISMYRADLAFF